MSLAWDEFNVVLVSQWNLLDSLGFTSMGGPALIGLEILIIGLTENWTTIGLIGTLD